MFVHQARLPHVLPAKLYWDAGQHSLERQMVFEPAWHQTLIGRLLVKLWGASKCRVIKQILSEDAALYPSIQRGIQSSPFQGMISVREELVHAFQRYVAAACGLKDQTS